MHPGYGIRRLLNPEIFQGARRKRRYFEGWYIKSIQRNAAPGASPETASGVATGDTGLALIPGVAAGEGGANAHAFLQLISAGTGWSRWLEFPRDAFSFRDDRFEVGLDGSRFSSQGVALSVDRPDIRIDGELAFDRIRPYPKTLFHPGIMGPYSFVPSMECRHGVVHLSHRVTGEIRVRSADAPDLAFRFPSGEGYIEKDWGRSFPSRWVWLQANHFEREGLSVMFSIADIPWIGRSFVGFLSFVMDGDRTDRFTTYNHARIESFAADEGTGRIRVVLSRRGRTLEIGAETAASSLLRAPRNGFMDRMIRESISARVTVRYRDRDGRVLFEGESPYAGLEILGDWSDFH